MTEEQWFACEKPPLMLEFLVSRTSERQLRLFGCCCCRSIWPLFNDERSRRAVAIGERFADGDADKDELEEARRTSWEAVRYVAGLNYAATHGRVMASYARMSAKRSSEAAAYAAGTSVGKVAAAISAAALEAVAEAAGLEGAREGLAAQARQLKLETERKQQIAFLRDIVGNPFRPVVFDPAWRTSTPVALARQMYDSREFGAMPILADALQDAGCEDEAILNHCRDANHVHVRGCWVCDLVLSK